MIWQNKRLLGIFYLNILFFGFIAMLPFRALLIGFVDDSMMGEKLAGNFDMDFMFEFLKNTPALSPLIVLTIIGVFSLYWLASIILSGGAFSLFFSGEKYSSANFWANTGAYAGRFIRLTIINLIALVILVGTSAGTILMLKSLLTDDPSGALTYWVKWLRIGVQQVALMTAFMIFDYSRIYTVANDEKSMMRAFFRGLGFTLRNYRRTFTLAFVFTIILETIGLFIYNPVSDAFAQPGWVILIMLFAWMQIYLLLQMVLKLALFAGEVDLYKELSGESNPAMLDEMGEVDLDIHPLAGE